MTPALSFMALGFFLGMRHATDPDHVIAMSALVTRQRTVVAGIALGAVWGLGHTLMIVAVGGAMIAFRVVLPPLLGATSELTAALMLIVLGLVNLSVLRPLLWPLRASGPAAHTHPHAHGDYVHSHRHGHGADDHGHAEHQTPQGWLDRHLARLTAYQLLRPFVLGILHGLAGSAAIALMVVATIHDARWSLAYLVLFGVGTIVGMMLVTAALAVPLAATRRGSPALQRGIRMASGAVSLAMGVFLVYRVGFVDRLFW